MGSEMCIRDSLKGDDIEAIKSAVEKLSAESQEMGKSLYESEAANGGATGGAGAAGAAGTDAGSDNSDPNVVDAEVVDEDKKDDDK